MPYAGNSSTSPNSLCCIDAVFINGACSQFLGIILQFDNSYDYLGICMGILWLTAHLDMTQSWYQKLRLVTKDIQLGLCLPNYLMISFRVSSYPYIFQKGFTVFGFITSHQMAFNFTFLSLFSIPQALLPLPSPFHFILLFKIHTQPYLSIVSLFQ